MTGDQTNHYQSAVAVCWLLKTPSHNRPSYSEQKARSCLTICEWLKKFREDGLLPRLSKSSQPIIGKEAS